MQQPPVIDYNPASIKKPATPHNHNDSFTGNVIVGDSIPWPRVSVKKLASYPMMEYWTDLLIRWSLAHQNYIYYNWQCSNGEQLYINRNKRFDQFTKQDWNDWLKWIDYDIPNLNPEFAGEKQPEPPMSLRLSRSATRNRRPTNTNTSRLRGGRKTRKNKRKN